MKICSLKNLFTLLIICFSFLACNSSEGISGKLAGIEKENVRIYLIQPQNLNEVAASFFGKIVDSAEVKVDGRFEFNNLPQSQDPVLLELAVKQPGKDPKFLQTEDPGKANYMPVVWQPGEEVNITANVNDFQQSFTIEQPSKVNQALLDLRDVKKRAFQEYLAGKHWQLEDASQLLKKEKARLQYQQELIKFAGHTEFLLPALVALRWVSPENDYERVPEFLVDQCNQWKKRQPAHPWVKQLCQKSDPGNLPVLVGDIFPNVKLPMMSKDTLSLQEQLGTKLTIIDLWASWCAPCRRENREVLVPLWNEYHNRGFQIIAYGLESNESAWRAAAERDGADKWLQASDLQGDDAAFLKKIRIRTIPSNFILDEKGKVIAKNIHGEALVDLVASRMKE